MHHNTQIFHPCKKEKQSLTSCVADYFSSVQEGEAKSDFTYMGVNEARRFLAGGPFGRSKTAATRLEDEATVHHGPSGPRAYWAYYSPL
jgi:hypothetical protein